MEEITFPYHGEITIDSIASNSKHEFGINKGDFEQEIFHASRWLSRVRHGEAKMDEIHFRNLFRFLKVYSGNTEALFIATMKRWYPSLNSYSDEKTIIDIIQANLEGNASDTIRPIITELDSKHFINICLEYTSPIKSIKIAEQTGDDWFDNHELTALLTHLIHKQIPIEIIVNIPTPMMKRIVTAVQEPSKSLQNMGITSVLSKWHEYEETYLNIKLHISEYPILHKTLIVEFEDTSSRAFISDYAYGSHVDVLAPHRQLFNNESAFKYYKNEFDYLWHASLTYAQWQATLPEPEETLKPDNYILLYLSHNKHSGNTQRWIYSALSITSENTVSLKVNITDSANTITADNYYEYSYHGKLKLSRNTIFISLYDEDSQEAISISLVRPLLSKERLIGIMTALSPSGQQPVAFKCACVGRSTLSRLDYPTLSRLLSHNNKEWGESLLVLENQDINLFYSDRIFTDKSR